MFNSQKKTRRVTWWRSVKIMATICFSSSLITCNKIQSPSCFIQNIQHHLNTNPNWWIFTAWPVKHFHWSRRETCWKKISNIKSLTPFYFFLVDGAYKVPFLWIAIWTYTKPVALFSIINIIFTIFFVNCFIIFGWC